MYVLPGPEQTGSTPRARFARSFNWSSTHKDLASSHTIGITIISTLTQESRPTHGSGESPPMKYSTRGTTTGLGVGRRHSAGKGGKGIVVFVLV